MATVQEAFVSVMKEHYPWMNDRAIQAIAGRFGSLATDAEGVAPAMQELSKQLAKDGQKEANLLVGNRWARELDKLLDQFREDLPGDRDDEPPSYYNM